MRKQQPIGIGTRLAGRYELVSEIARGAMGDVYRATDHQERCQVVVKILRAEYLTNEAMRRRLRREGAVLKALDHPSIVRLLDLGIDENGLVFLVTELVEGRTLAERLTEGPVDLESAAQLLTALSGALTAAHDHGVLHGDLKPANVLWVLPVPRLIDFGASKVLGLDRLTATGEVAGTPAYMAPEVLTGKADVDERIDVYGLGVLLYEALSAQRPFQDAHVGRLLMKIDAGDRLPLDALVEIPEAIANVIHRAMHRDKESRFGTVMELEAAWQQAAGSGVA
ncbi:MAG: serine/threonine protein kinase [Myxococcales bacterium]|nr:serine/threonine protein kinase [Myxococcales bacterium]MDH3482602.1 serine/threonine protein kinase [Myxococcales bacterium]